MADNSPGTSRPRHPSRTRSVLITGATSGIGLELARLYARQGRRLVLVGRKDPKDLDRSLFAREPYCRTDLTSPRAADNILDFLSRREIHSLDLLIHNAAVGFYGPVEEQPGESVEELVQVNLLVPLLLSSALLSRLRKARGKIVLIGSVVAALPCPQYAVYAATKAALEGLGRSLARELRGEVAVQVIHPGATRTAMHAKIGLPPEVADWRKFPPAETTASGIARAIEGNRRSVTLGLGNRIVGSAARLLARPVDAWMRRRQRRCSV